MRPCQPGLLRGGRGGALGASSTVDEGELSACDAKVVKPENKYDDDDDDDEEEEEEGFPPSPGKGDVDALILRRNVLF